MIDTIRIDNSNVLRALPREPTHAAVLFIHGYFVDARVWTQWLERFAAHGIPAYAIHLRGRAGSGSSETDVGRISIEDFVSDTAVVAREVDAKTIVGHSMGGLVVQKLAERGAMKAAVLITPAPPRGITVLSRKLIEKQVRYLPAIFLSRPVHPRREHLRELVLNRVPPDQHDRLLDFILPDSGRAAREMSITGVPVDADRVRMPMLVIAGEDDQFVPSTAVARVAARYGVPLEIMPGHGHMIVLEPGWEGLADRVESWIRENG